MIVEKWEGAEGALKGGWGGETRSWISEKDERSLRKNTFAIFKNSCKDIGEEYFFTLTNYINAFSFFSIINNCFLKRFF